MARKLKILGFALFASVAINAVAATAASANNITVSNAKYPAQITAADVGTEDGKFIRFTIGSGVRFIECSSWSTQATLSAEATKLNTVTSYGNCFANGLTSQPATITQNGCSHTLEATGTTAAQTTIDCPEGKQVEISIYESATKHAQNLPLCRYDMKPQGPLTGISIEASNAGTSTEDLLLNFHISGIKMTSTVGTAAFCGIAAGKEGTAGLQGIATVTGETDNETKLHVPIMIQ